MGKMCRNIQALVNTVVLTPASCPKGVCGHGKTIFGAGVNSLLIVHKGTCLSNVRGLAARLLTVGSVKLRCFCDRLSLIFLVGWFLDLKTAGKIAAHYSACAPSGQGPKQRVVSGIFKI